jgi:hypothetical protein
LFTPSLAAPQVQVWVLLFTLYSEFGFPQVSHSQCPAKYIIEGKLQQVVGATTLNPCAAGQNKTSHSILLQYSVSVIPHNRQFPAA